MEFEMICTKHNFGFGFQRPKNGVESAQLICPLCAKERMEALTLQVRELTEHRDLLLRVIDLKQLVQPYAGDEA